MSTELLPVPKVKGCPEVSLTQFAGGQERGLCLQLTQLQKDRSQTSHQFLQVNAEQAVELADALMQWVNHVRPEA